MSFFFALDSEARASALIRKQGGKCFYHLARLCSFVMHAARHTDENLGQKKLFSQLGIGANPRTKLTPQMSSITKQRTKGKLQLNSIQNSSSCNIPCGIQQMAYYTTDTVQNPTIQMNGWDLGLLGVNFLPLGNIANLHPYKVGFYVNY